MKNQQLVLFNNDEVKVITDNGQTLINLCNTAKVCSLIQTKPNGSIKIRWSRIKEKLNTIGSKGQTLEPQYIEELNYILDEIENTDDRTQIFMSRYLTSRLAMECHSDSAMQYKSWLAQLDEKYSKGELTNGNQIEQLGNIANQMNLVASTMGQIGQAFVGLQEFVKDSIQVKDSQIDDIRELCGMKSANTIKLSKYLKEHLEIIFKRKLWATSYEYKEAKQNVFEFFNVTKWEDIPIEKYKKVHSYIDTLSYEDVIDNPIKAVD
ncbi:hypothetical protein [Clostridium sp. M14]|uniref:hypothetical protein n=1 Tax=Clostridium sp. M14 TaxID=2716311 RepID=UPI0013EEAD93|nr:hypothetical protein [Clostridium sp. M14]MBZ9693203.1 hypothetical protein [Clostridium sp. M14]